jgi:hypothetical protein
VYFVYFVLLILFFRGVVKWNVCFAVASADFISATQHKSLKLHRKYGSLNCAGRVRIYSGGQTARRVLTNCYNSSEIF